MISKEAERGMALIIEVVTSIRNLRASWGIPPAKEVKVLIRTKAKEVEGILNGNQDRVKGLAKVEGMAIGALDRPRGAATSVLKDVEIFVPLAGLIDVQKEKDKIKAQMAGVEKEIAAAKGRLRDKRFLSKAPKDVVDIQRTRLGELKEKLGVLKANLQGLD
jgi:valyl-tRNA synthetase